MQLSTRLREPKKIVAPAERPKVAGANASPTNVLTIRSSILSSFSVIITIKKVRNDIAINFIFLKLDKINLKYF
jgi:hypothetical protein